MFSLQLQVQPQTEQRLKKLLTYTQDQERFAQNMIAYHVAELHKSILNIRLDLKQFEDQYQMATADFYHQFTQGTLPDLEAYMIWAGIYELLQENERHLRELQ
jgi:hypothetical protein